ncbi:MAG TPA: diguanylate cyclase, partial [Pusillimonas sp.]|nr:diguanylate cyclase [Pusillimonas sp.]
MKGFHLSIDDLGTGFSSLLQLVRLPFSELKVDKSFVITAAVSSESRQVIQAIVSLGQSLGMQSTAEGVEDATTLQFLREIGCNFAQGFHIARPMEKDAAANWTHFTLP